MDTKNENKLYTGACYIVVHDGRIYELIYYLYKWKDWNDAKLSYIYARERKREKAQLSIADAKVLLFNG